jgi:hypothetical protein
MSDRWEIKDELLAVAAAAGFEVSEAQLARWHRAGLLPRPQVRSLGRARGTQSLYPAGTSKRLIRVAEVHAREHRLGYAAWRLWWEDGGRLSKPARELLEAVAAKFDSDRAELAEVWDADQRGEEQAQQKIDELYRVAEEARLEPPLSEVRGRMGKESFARLLPLLVELGLGRLSGWDNNAEASEQATAFERGIGLAHARIGRAGAEPWLQDGIGPDLARLSEFISRHPMNELARASDDELDQARQQLRAFLATVTAAATYIGYLFGDEAFGFGPIARALKLEHPRRQAFFLLAFAGMRREPDLHVGIETLAALQPQAEAARRAQQAMEQMRIEVPGFEELFSPERLRAAQLDAHEAERLHADIAATANDHREEVDAFFAKHPELQQAIEPPDGPSG